MLVLCRTVNEAIRISDDISIVVQKVRGDKVYLAIEAPRNVTVHRQEVYDVIHKGTSLKARAGISPARSTHEEQQGDSRSPSW